MPYTSLAEVSRRYATTRLFVRGSPALKRGANVGLPLRG
jgi:hypothetical protein